MFGGETLYQLRAALQLAEIEREGVSVFQTQPCGTGWGQSSGGGGKSVLNTIKGDWVGTILRGRGKCDPNTTICGPGWVQSSYGGGGMCGPDTTKGYWVQIVLLGSE